MLTAYPASQVVAHRVQGPESPFSLYIQNLPVGVSGIPMFFDRQALRAIEYAPVTRQVQMRCQWLLHFAKETLQPLPGTLADPFRGNLVDANALGTPQMSAPTILRCHLVAVPGCDQPSSGRCDGGDMCACMAATLIAFI